MDQQAANDRMTKQPTPEGQPITSDEVFELFAALAGDSPWSIRLLRIRDIFNNLATAAMQISEVAQVHNLSAFLNAETDPTARKFMAALELMRRTMDSMHVAVDTAGVPMIHTPKED